MNNKHRKTLQAVFAFPMSGVVEWKALEALLVAAGETFSKVLVFGGGGGFPRGAVLLTPQPPQGGETQWSIGHTAKPYQVRDARAFLEAIGVTP